ncbi:HDOD domain-containing protein [Oceanobacter mangrovi]|uniref:HDOD domain-containing protein n=1 Tax=Oceanobacter mangrovi TaxID=2862510 RepID=UPI001C8E5C77|nr:HDOD domain-containing protein [Oceanobacter mangrovi]
MAIPASVQKVLDDWKVRYSVTDDLQNEHVMVETGNRPANLAKVIFLKDSAGLVQAVIPSNRILDLNLISHRLGRQFTAVGAAELSRLKQQLGLEDFPALPQLTGQESLVDQSLLDYDHLLIQAGQGDTQLKLPADQFRALTVSSHIGSYSVPVQIDIHYSDADSDKEDIHAAVRQFTPLRIQQRLQDTLDLPPLPETAHRIIELRIDPDADTVSLARAIETDPSISAQVMSWARSPYYRPRGMVNNVEDAVLRVLGFDLVMNLSLGLSLGRSLAIPREGPHGYTPFWQQAVMGAALNNELARKIKGKLRPDAGLAYLAGLLHNFGFLVLGQVFPPQFSLVNRHIEANPHINRFYIERHLLGVCREQIAATLLRQWQLPDEIVIALRQQHNPFYCGNHANYAHLNYVMTRALRRHGYGDGPDETPDPNILEALGLTLATVDEVTSELLNHVGELSELVTLLER